MPFALCPRVAEFSGGGLDSQKLGRLLGSKCFAEDEEALTPAELSGEWKSYPGHMKVSRRRETPPDSHGWAVQ